MGSTAKRTKSLLVLAIALAWIPLVLAAGSAHAHVVAASGEHAEESQLGHSEGHEGGHVEHHEDEHGVHHGHHGHGGHHEASSAMVTTSFLLIGFLVINFVMLWLVNWPDPHVRSYTWRMMSATVSIYLAVLIINSTSSFVLWVVTKKPEGAGGFSNIDLGLRSSLFVFCFVVGNLLCYYLRDQKKLLYATQVIGAHITAFAGIGAFSVLLQLDDGHSETFAACTAIVALCLVLLRVASRCVRNRVFGAQCESEHGRHMLLDRYTNKQHGHHGHQHTWRHAICEAEDDACSIMASFVVQELVMMCLFRREKHTLLHQHDSDSIRRLCVAQGICALLIVSITYARRYLDRKFNQAASNPLSPYSRLLSSVQIMVAMAMSWLALYLFFWITADLFPTIEHEFIEIISAAILTASAILGIMVMDKFADKVDEFEATMQQEDVALNQVDDQEDDPVIRMTSSSISDDALKHALDLQNLEKALRMLIDGFALAVGLAWEKAFHAALETVVDTVEVSKHHQVISRFAMAFLSSLLMLPIWLKFIVPMARRSVQEFQRHIDFDKEELLVNG